MVKVTYIEDGGATHAVEIPEGWTAMQGAMRNGVDGIEAECGGSCACATCHCYVDEAFLDRLPPPGATEDAMLDNTAAERLPNSRLSCQIKLTPELDGLILRLPETQS